MAIISIEGMEFFSYHGCFKEEQEIGTKFNIDLYLTVDTSIAEKSDSLSDTVNYQEVFRLVKAEMQINSKLLEHVAYRILQKVKSQFPQVEDAKVKIKKLNPPLGGKMDFVSVTLEY